MQGGDRRFHMRPSPIFRRPEFSEGELLFATECFLDANFERLQLEQCSLKPLVENARFYQDTLRHTVLAVLHRIEIQSRLPALGPSATNPFLDAKPEPSQLELSSEKTLVDVVKMHMTGSY